MNNTEHPLEDLRSFLINRCSEHQPYFILDSRTSGGIFLPRKETIPEGTECLDLFLKGERFLLIDLTKNGYVASADFWSLKKAGRKVATEIDKRIKAEKLWGAVCEITHFLNHEGKEVGHLNECCFRVGPFFGGVDTGVSSRTALRLLSDVPKVFEVRGTFQPLAKKKVLEFAHLDHEEEAGMLEIKAFQAFIYTKSGFLRFVEGCNRAHIPLQSVKKSDLMLSIG